MRYHLLDGGHKLALGIEEKLSRGHYTISGHKTGLNQNHAIVTSRSQHNFTAGKAAVTVGDEDYAIGRGGANDSVSRYLKRFWRHEDVQFDGVAYIWGRMRSLELGRVIRTRAVLDLPST